VNDPATATCPPPPRHDYTQFFEAGALKGARIGIPRAFYYDKITPPGTKEPRGGLSPDQARLMAEAIAILKQQGAVVVDPADIPSVVDKEEKSNLLRRAKDLALAGTHGVDEVMKAQGLDAILFPGASGAAIAAPPGYPTVIVPFGTVPNAPDSSVPDGIAGKPPAFGVSFTGMACSEPRLLALAYAFEEATRRRGPPPSAP
jgi:amidase